MGLNTGLRPSSGVRFHLQDCLQPQLNRLAPHRFKAAMTCYHQLYSKIYFSLQLRWVHLRGTPLNNSQPSPGESYHWQSP